MMKQWLTTVVTIAIAMVIGIGTVQATNLTWDENGATLPNPQDGTGNWLDTDHWWDGAASATWNNTTPDNATIGVGGNGGTITLGAVTNGTVTMNNHAGTYWLSSGTLDTSGGITIGASAGNVSISTVISGTGGITKNSPGLLVLSGTWHQHSGAVVANDGVLQLGTGYGDSWNFSTNANLEINDATIYTFYYGSKTLGTGPNEMQFTGGTCGLSSGQGDAAGNIWTINGTETYEVVWGTNVFNPSTLLLGDANVNVAVFTKLGNKFDLNGANRTIGVTSTTMGSSGSGAPGYLSGVIRNAAGTPAGIIKTGAGELWLSNSGNSFDGPMDIQGGALLVTSMANGGANSGMGASTAAAANLKMSNGGVLRYEGSGHSSDRAFTIDGTAGGGSGGFEASGSGALDLTTNAAPAWGTVNQPRTLILGGTSPDDNTLAANIGDNGTAAVSVTKTNGGVWVLSGTSTYTGNSTSYDGALVATGPSSLPGWNVASKVAFEGGVVGARVGGSGFSTANVDTLLANATKTSGALGIDTTNGDLTQWSAFTAANFGSLGLAKLGDNKLTLIAGNTYTGPTLLFKGTLAADTDVDIGDLVIAGPNVTVSGDGSLDFAPGSVIADEYIRPVDNATDVSSISCGISGSPDVDMTKSHAQAGGTSVNTLRFEPSANSTQTLGDIEFNHPGGSQAALVILAGVSSNNTLGSVYKVAAHSYNQHLYVEGPGKWTLNGDIGKSTDTGVVQWRVDGGTLIFNGNSVQKPYLQRVENGRLGGDFTYGSTGNLGLSGVPIKGGGILSPGDGGIGKMSFNWGSSGSAREFDMADNSVYEWDVDATTNDLVELAHIQGTSLFDFTLDLNDFALKIQDASGSEYVSARVMPVFKYSGDVIVDMADFANNIDTSALGVEWQTGSLALVDDGLGTIHLTGLTKPPPLGTLLTIR
jgi:fibronectin-binding autotransporter adhesin